MLREGLANTKPLGALRAVPDASGVLVSGETGSLATHPGITPIGETVIDATGQSLVRPLTRTESGENGGAASGAAVVT